MDGTKVTQTVSSDARTAATHGLSDAGVAIGAEERDELHHHDQRPGGGLSQREPVDHLAAGHPVVGVDRLLGDVGEHGVGAAEGDHGGAGEELALFDEHAVAAEQDGGREHGRRPQDEPEDQDAQRVAA